MRSGPTNYEEIRAAVEDVQGFMVPGQERYLFEKVRSLGEDAVILEIGSYKGRSTVAMGYACAGTRRRIYCVDTWDGNDKDFPERNFFDIWKENVRRNGLGDYVFPLRGLSHEVLAKWKSLAGGRPIDFAFIDGSHEYSDVLRDFQMTWPLVKDGGWIAFHDVHYTWPGPARVWYDVGKRSLAEHEYESTIACGRKPGGGELARPAGTPAAKVAGPRGAELPVHFFTIVLNGEPYIRHHVEQMKKLPFRWHWHVVEGVAELKHDTAWSVAAGGKVPDSADRAGRSADGTSDYLDQLQREMPQNVTVYRKLPGRRWDGKLEMVNHPLWALGEECLLWEIDADELWTAEQFEAGRKLFLDDPSRTAAMYWCWMFVGPDLVTSTRNCYANNPQMEWIRTWRYRPGMRWAAHEPPILAEQMANGQWRSVVQVNPLLHDRTEAAGLVFQHYAYATERQVRFKQDYYGYRAAVHKWRALQRVTQFPVLLRDFFAWVGDDTAVDRAESFVARALMPPDSLKGPPAAAEDLEDRLYRALFDRANKQRVYRIITRLTPDRWLAEDLIVYQHASSHETAWFDSVTLLNWCARHLRPATYLEVGVRRGRSMAQVLGESPDTRAFGFDLWVPGYAYVDNPGPHVALEEFRRLGIRNLPRMTTGDSHQTLPAFFADAANPREIDLIFIDGDHTYHGAKLDLDLAFDHLAPGGVLAFDDITHHAHRELLTLWDEYKARFPDYLFIEDPRPTGIGAAFKPPFDKLIRALDEIDRRSLNKDDGARERIDLPRIQLDEFVDKVRPRVVIDGVFFQMFNTGIARVWTSLLEQWARDGFARNILVLDRVGTAPKVDGVRYRVVPRYDYNDAAADREMLQRVCDEESADAFASTYYTTPLATPQLFMIHDMIPELFGWDLRHPMWREKHQGVRRAAAFVAVSESTRRDFLKFFPNLNPDNVRVTPLAASPVFSPRPDADVRAFREKFAVRRPYFLIVGARGGYKNTILSFRGLSKLRDLPDIEIVCTGGGPLEPEFASLVPTDNVKVISRTSDEELAAAYSGAAALLHPSTYEGFGLPVLEAMACACPVITTKNGSLTEVAGDAALLVADNDVDAMARALDEVRRADVRRRLADAGLRQAAKFSWERTATQVREALESVASTSEVNH